MQIYRNLSYIDSLVNVAVDLEVCLTNCPECVKRSQKDHFTHEIRSSKSTTLSYALDKIYLPNLYVFLHSFFENSTVKIDIFQNKQERKANLTDSYLVAQ